MPKDDVLIGHPSGNGFSFHAAQSIFESGRLNAFCVAWLPSAFEVAALATAGRLSRGFQRLGRRSFPALGSAHVIQGRIPEFARLIRRAFGGPDTSQLVAYEANDWLMRTMAKHTKRDNVRIVHSYEDCSLTQFQTAKKCGKFCVYDLPIGFHRAWARIQGQLIDEYGDWLPDGGMRSSRFARPLQKDAEIELADAVLAPSQFVLNTVREYFPQKQLFLTPYGVDCDYWRPSSAPRAPGPLRFLFAGQVGVRKGVPVLLKAWHEAGLSDARLDLAGLWDLSDKNRGEIKGNVYYHGMLSREELRKLFQSVDVFVFPSFFEGFALTALEAMACGLPTITTEIFSGMNLVNSQNGRIVQSGSVEHLAAAIAEFGAKRSMLPEMARFARESVIKYSWENYRRSITEAYGQFQTN